jgi:hypothetical protein
METVAPPEDSFDKKKRKKKAVSLPTPIFEVGWSDTVFKDEISKLPIHIVLAGIKLYYIICF